MNTAKYSKILSRGNNNKQSIVAGLKLADYYVGESPDESMKTLQKISGIVEQFGSNDDKIAYKTIKAKVLSTKGENQRAYEELYSLQIDNEQNVSAEILCDVFLTISTVEMLLGDYPASIENGKKVILLTKNTLNDEKRAHAHSTVSQSELALGQLRAAKKNANEAFKIFSELNNYTRMAIALNSMAGCELALNRPDSARKYYHDALQCLENSSDVKKEKVYATILNNLVNVQILFCDYTNAIINLKKSYAFFKRNNDVNGSITTLVNMGTIYLQINNSFESLRCLYEAQEIAQKNNTEHLLCGIEANLALALVQIGDFSKALILLKGALAFARKYKSLRQECHVLIGLGRVYGQIEKKQTAIKLFYNALQLSEQQDDKNIIATTRIALGDFYVKNGEWHEAALQYLMAVEILSVLKTVRYLAEAYSGAARSFLEMGQKDIAGEYMEQAMLHVKTVHEKSLLISIHENATLIYEASGESAKAVKSFKQYLRISDELDKQKNISDILTLHVQKEKKNSDSYLSELSLELKRIHKENELLKRELRLQVLRNVHDKEIIIQIRKEVLTDSISADEIVRKTSGILRTTDSSEHLWVSLQNELKRSDPDLTNILLKKFPSLTKMELKVCSLIALGMSSKNIASMLFVEKITIDKHRQNIRKKMKMEANEDIALFLERISL